MTGISACLLGFCCRYDGKSKPEKNIIEFVKNNKDFFHFCPEQMGGLSTPRIPCEIKNNKVFNKNNEDKTMNFEKGCYETLKAFELYKPDLLILKENSPSCGVFCIYDGNFCGKKISKNGMLIDILKKNNFSFEIIKEQSNNSYTTIRIL